MKEDKQLWEILVPRYSNERIEYSLDHHKIWDEKIRGFGGGLTILKTVKGQWISPEIELFVEQMIPVRVLCDEKTIDKIIDLTLDHYNQQAVLAYEISRNIKLKYKKK